MSRWLRAALLAGAAVFVALAPTAAGAANARDAGWWWKPQSGQLVALPPPPGVPEGGLMVQSAVDGATAIAAVRYQMDDDETAPVLALRLVESGNQAAEAAIVLACPTATPWQLGPAQPWAEKPEPDCSRQALGTLAEDGTTMSFDLAEVATAPLVDIVLVPGTVEGMPEGINGASFTLVFEAPVDDDLVIQRAAPTTPPSTSGHQLSSAPPSTPASDDRPQWVPSLTPRPADHADVVTTSSLAAGSDGMTSNFSPPAVRPSTPLATFGPVSAPDASDARTLAGVVLAVVALATIRAGRREHTVTWFGWASPHAADAHGMVSGVGRFATERPGPPPSLR